MSEPIYKLWITCEVHYPHWLYQGLKNLLLTEWVEESDDTLINPHYFLEGNCNVHPYFVIAFMITINVNVSSCIILYCINVTVLVQTRDGFTFYTFVSSNFQTFLTDFEKEKVLNQSVFYAFYAITILFSLERILQQQPLLYSKKYST